MKDQVDGATRRGIRAIALNSSTTPIERVMISAQIHTGICKLLYVSPERLAVPKFKKFLTSVPVSAIVIDEAHCIAEYGPEFRPEYHRIGETVKGLNIPVFACTATATRETEKTIIESLGMTDPAIIRGTFNRPNLYYDIVSKEIDEITQLAQLVRGLPGSGIIYRTTRSSVDDTAIKLSLLGFDAQPYHAGMQPADRARIQDEFLSGKIRIIVASIAFGMGIDKPDIRWVIHADIPKSIEGYYQETGRAGRDGMTAWCYFLYSKRDIPMIRKFIDRTLNMVNRKKAYMQFLEMVAYAETKKCRRKQLLNYFGESAPDRCSNCDICHENERV